MSSPIRLTCPACQTPCALREELLGKTIRCPKCKHTFQAKPSPAPEEDIPLAMIVAPPPTPPPAPPDPPASADIFAGGSLTPMARKPGGSDDPFAGLEPQSESEPEPTPTRTPKLGRLGGGQDGPTDDLFAGTESTPPRPKAVDRKPAVRANARPVSQKPARYGLGGMLARLSAALFAALVLSAVGIGAVLWTTLKPTNTTTTSPATRLLGGLRGSVAVNPNLRDSSARVSAEGTLFDCR